MNMNVADIGFATNSSKLVKPKSSVDPEKAWQAAQDFEAAFTSHILQEVLSSNKEGMFGGGQTEVMFRSIMTEKIAQSMPGMFGIAESVYPILLKGQDVDNVTKPM